MIRRLSSYIRTDRDGQTLAVAAVMMVAIFAVMAIAIDLGLAYTARTEAQRAADAAALAGASVFMEYPLPTDYEAQIQRRAREYAARNFVRNVAVASGFTAGAPVVETEGNEVRVQIIDEEGKVRVWVRREGIATWFARLIGVDHIAVAAMAAAQVKSVGAARCVMPWIVMDAFLRDTNHPRYDESTVPDEGESYNEEVHRYAPAISQCDPTSTGFGAETDRTQYSTAGCDYGRPIVLRKSDPLNPHVPGNFLSIRLGDSNGVPEYQRNIEECHPDPVSIGDVVEPEPGVYPLATPQAVRRLISGDDGRWDPSANEGEGGVVGGEGKRLVIVALAAPDGIARPGLVDIVVQNFGMFFIENVFDTGRPTEHRIEGRFLYYVPGFDGGTHQSDLLKTLRLVE
jgi:Flp pilus assembly protein TadG